MNKRTFKISSIVELKKLPKYWNKKIPKNINSKSDIEWVISSNLGLNITGRTKDKGGMYITYRIPLYFVIFQLLSS